MCWLAGPALAVVSVQAARQPVLRPDSVSGPGVNMLTVRADAGHVRAGDQALLRLPADCYAAMRVEVPAFVRGEPGLANGLAAGDVRLEPAGAAYAERTNLYAAWALKVDRVSDEARPVEMWLMVDYLRVPGGRSGPVALRWETPSGSGLAATDPVLAMLPTPADATPPAVAGTVPRPGERDIAPACPAVISYSESVNPGPGLRYVEAWADGRPLAVATRVEDTRLVVYPVAERWPEGARVTVKVPPSAVRDAAGNHPRGEYVLEFYVRSARAPEQPPFSDLSGHPAADAVRRLAAAGVVRGYPDGTFRPEEPATRYMLAVWLARLLALEAPDAEAGLAGLTDAGAVPSWARAEVAAVRSAGLMRGELRGDGVYFAGERQLTLGELALVLWRVQHREGPPAPEPTPAVALDLFEHRLGAAALLPDQPVSRGALAEALWKSMAVP